MRIAVLAAAGCALAGAAGAEPARLVGPWPNGDALVAVEERRVGWPSSSPFTPWDALVGNAAPTEAGTRLAASALIGRATARRPVAKPSSTLLRGA